MLSDGSLKRFFNLQDNMFRLFFIRRNNLVVSTKPRNSNSWVSFKIDFCPCISNPNFMSKFTVTSIFSRHSLSVLSYKKESSTTTTER